MKLTHEIRDQIIRSMTRSAIEKEEAVLKKHENALALKLWKAAYPAAERNAALAMTAGWVRMDSCLRFNLGGMDIRINSAEPVPVKASVNGFCQRLGDIADEKLRDEYLAYFKDLEALKQKARDVERQGKALLYNITTFKRLEEVWPEGKKFYDKFRPINEKAGVPAMLTHDLNALIGIKVKVAK